MAILADRRFLTLALVASLAFNVGFVASRGLDAEPTVAVIDHDAYPAEFNRLCERLEGDVQSLRVVQAEHTRELADLMSAAEPDLEAIEGCLDCLAHTERKIKGALVHTVLSQRELLPPEQRARFCDQVRTRLCTPWEGCASSTPCAPHECATDQRGHRNDHGGKHDS